MSGGLLVAGTTSDAGKSVVTAGICRWLVRQGVKVAPFKGQNMSLNSFVTREGAEIGRAQAMQAQAARVEPSALMNPVLLKPGSDRSSQVVLMGKPVGELSASGYHGGRQEALLGTVVDCLERLRGTYDAVICEGAGSPAEINLRRTDIVNMGVARAAKLPVVVVGDIDRGGVFASFFGTTALLSPEDQALVAGYIVNKFAVTSRCWNPASTCCAGSPAATRTGSCRSRTASASTRRTAFACPCAAPCASPWWRRRWARTCCGWRSAPSR